MNLSTYLVLLAHDRGKYVLKVTASSKEAAKTMVMKAEGCPASAIKGIKLALNKRGRKNPGGSDPIVRKTAQGYEVSDIIDGYRVHKHYIGYTKKQAVALFKKEHNLTRKNPSLVKATVWSYDVWGNARDGWEVNDRSKFGTFELAGDLTDDKAILRFLKVIGFLKKGVRLTSVEFDGDDQQIYVNQARDGYPLCGIDIETVTK